MKPNQTAFTPIVSIRQPLTLRWTKVFIVDSHMELNVLDTTLCIFDNDAKGSIAYPALLERCKTQICRHILALPVGDAGWMRTGAVDCNGDDVWIAVYMD